LTIFRAESAPQQRLEDVHFAVAACEDPDIARRTCNLTFPHIVTIKSHCFRKNAALRAGVSARLKAGRYSYCGM
jgi:hypothetical protein